MKPENIMNQPDASTLLTFGTRVLGDTSRDIGLLGAIESTLDALSLSENEIKGLANFAEEASERIAGLTPQKQIDPEGKIVDLLEKAQERVHEYYLALIIKRNSAIADTRLCEEDGIVEAYKEIISTAADLHNGLNSLRWAIMEHDADLDTPTGRVFTNANELDDYLASL